MVSSIILIIGWGVTGACVWKLARAKGFALRVRWLMVSVLAAGCMAFSSGVFFLVRSFLILNREIPVASIEVHPVKKQAFQIAYRPFDESKEARTFMLSGEQWLVGGGFIKWHPLVQWFNIPPFFIPLRVEGRYARAEEQSRQKITAFALDPEVEARWDLVYAASQWLPFVDASYGSAVFVPVTGTATFELFAGRDGFIVRPAPAYGSGSSTHP